MSDSFEIKDEYRTIFLEESEDQLREWEEALLALEKTPTEKELIDKIFRAIHTLKGSAGFVGFEELQKVAHDLESGLQEIRDGKRQVNKSSLDILFEGLDICQKLIESFGESKQYDGNVEQFLQKIQSFSNIDSETQNNKDNKSNDLQPAEDVEESISETSPDDLTDDGSLWSLDIQIEATQREAYLRSLLLQSRLGEIGKIVSINPPIDELMKLGDDLKFRLILQTEKQRDDLERAANIDQVKVLNISKLNKDLESQGKKEQESDLVEKGKATSENKNQTKYSQSKSKSTDKILKHNDEVVRVPVEKLDVMLNLVGELVVQNSGFVSVTKKLKESYGRTGLIMDLEEKIENLAKIARDLQDSVMKVRMLPIGNVFNRFYRVVRDLSRVRNKDIELEVYGEETEIDKKIIDRIGEPLVHLIRNAVDHGIESVEDRKRLGKTLPAHIRLGAYQEGDHICIEVSDDGRGMDRDAILEKAFEKGLVQASEASKMSNEDVYNLVFYPGFSTAKEITDISGRGVGLDVVKSTIDEMGGDVRVRSTKNYGTTIILTLPLTMAIISAILVVAFDSLFAIPISSVQEIIKIRIDEFKKIRENKVIRLRDEIISVVYLNEILGVSKNHEYKNLEKKEIPIIIVDYENTKVGIGVDRLIGNEEIVIKSLSKHYKEVDGLAGASILGDGRIALILDIQSLVKNYGKSDTTSYNVIHQEKEILKSNASDITHESEGDETENIEEESIFDIFEEKPEITTSQISTTDEQEDTGLKESSLSDTGKSLKTNNDTTDDSLSVCISSRQKEIIEELHTNGAINASMSMTQLMGRDVRVSFPSIETINIQDVSEKLGGEENPVGGIYVGISGDIAGGVLIVLSIDYMKQFSDFLLKREPGTTDEINEEERSALQEMGNILSAAFINSISDITGLSALTDVPEMSIDMCQSVIDTILIRFNQPGDKILLTEAEIYFSDDEQAVCNLLLFLEKESIKKLSNTVINNEMINV